MRNFIGYLHCWRQSNKSGHGRPVFKLSKPDTVIGGKITHAVVV